MPCALCYPQLIEQNNRNLKKMLCAFRRALQFLFNYLLAQSSRLLAPSYGGQALTH